MMILLLMVMMTMIIIITILVIITIIITIVTTMVSHKQWMISKSVDCSFRLRNLYRVRAEDFRSLPGSSTALISSNISWSCLVSVSHTLFKMVQMM